MRERFDDDIKVRLRKSDRERLELIRETMGVSLAGAIRASLVAMCRQLGYEKEFRPDFLKRANND
jgi:hypothetical protein